MTLTNESSVSQFIDAADPIRLLTDATAIHFRPEDDVYREHPATSDEVMTCLKDLKVRIAHQVEPAKVVRVCSWRWNEEARGNGCEVRSKLPRLSPTVVLDARLVSGKPTGSQSAAQDAKRPSAV